MIRFISIIIFFMSVRSNSDFEENDSGMELMVMVQTDRGVSGRDGLGPIRRKGGGT